MNIPDQPKTCSGTTGLKKYFVLLLLVLFHFSTFSQYAGVLFPKEIIAPGGQVITIYQPQPESFSGNKLTGRSALSVRKNANAEPIFGAIFYDATVSTDKENRIAQCEKIKITNVKFPGIEDKSKLDSLVKIIEDQVPKWNLRISIDALVATIKMETVGVQDQFNNTPPVIYYRNRPTTLILIDGEPKIQKDKKLGGDRIVNTPALIFREETEWNLYSGGVWYTSGWIKSGWKQNLKFSKKIKSIDDQIKKEEAKKDTGKKSTGAPIVTEILVSTEPAELLQTNGDAVFKSIQGTELLYASNTTDQIFIQIATQSVYTVLSGRWFSAPSLEGPWQYIASDKLPADFAKIPEGSEKDEVLANIAGTAAAEEAKIDAQIPQTAKVSRKTASIKVEYDGDPKFKKIEGTSLELAENSNITVIRDSIGKYYAVENGVWFVADKDKGPWKVSDTRPEDVSEIPPNSSAYNTKYVYVYESDPEYVYVGYTPGYLGSYVYGPTVVYGTGFYYAPWYGAYYYPHAVTWGFGFCYNPWYGWSMGYAYGTAYGYVNMNFAFGYGWYGPPMYYPPYRPYYGGGYYGGIGNGGIGNDINIGDGNRVTHHDGGRNNLYNNRNGVSTMDKKPGQSLNRPTQGAVNRGGPATVNNQLPAQGGQVRQSRQSNNVFADKSGNVYQRDNNGNWTQRNNQNRSWDRTPTNSPSVSAMNRASMDRYRGNTRTNNFNSQRNYGGYGAGARTYGGGARSFGGGGRRR